LERKVSLKLYRPEKSGTPFFKCRILYPGKIPSGNEGKITTFSDKVQLKEFVTCSSLLKRWPSKSLGIGRKLNKRRNQKKEHGKRKIWLATVTSLKTQKLSVFIQTEVGILNDPI
jgi:hypothetical protein